MAERTPLHDRHISLGARMFEFAGWKMPLWYSSITEEHLAVRGEVGLFDTSHLGKILVRGESAAEELDRMVTRAVSRARSSRGLYAHMLTDRGGIIDDMIITRLDNSKFLIICNAAKREQVIEWMNSRRQRFELKDLTEVYGCLAVQGPKTVDLLANLFDEKILDIRRYHAAYTRLSIPRKSGGRRETINDWAGEIAISDGGEGIEAFVTRTGYTGEDGFEIFVPADESVRVWNEILEAGREHEIRPCGLGARDTLRLEMCYLLSGQDFDGAQTPLEADAEFVIDWDHDFTGKEALELQRGNGYARLVAIESAGKGIPRNGYAICSERSDRIGRITSGSLSPSLRIGIGMGYLPPELSSPCNRIFFMVGSRKVEGYVVEKPFLKRQRSG